MGRRIEFKAVLNDLAQSLGTRNNDYLGYWAPGQLYKLALDLGVSNIVVDIFENQVIPASEHFDKLAVAYKQKILTNITTRGMNASWVSGAWIEYQFETEINTKYHSSFGVGEPYLGQLTIRSDLGKEYTGGFGGYCKPHNPKQEKRSTRF